MIKRNGSSHVVTALACAMASLASPAMADTAYEMSSYSDWPGGKQIAQRDYAAAIAVASRATARVDATMVLVAATNLCVAYTVTRAFAEARPACDQAVALAQRVDRTAFGRFPHGTATARALSNRGVLRAVSGDSHDAASDFEAATRLRGTSAVPGRNLAHLQSSPSNRVAAVEEATD